MFSIGNVTLETPSHLATEMLNARTADEIRNSFLHRILLKSNTLRYVRSTKSLGYRIFKQSDEHIEAERLAFACVLFNKNVNDLLEMSNGATATAFIEPKLSNTNVRIGKLWFKAIVYTTGEFAIQFLFNQNAELDNVEISELGLNEEQAEIADTELMTALTLTETYLANVTEATTK